VESVCATPVTAWARRKRREEVEGQFRVPWDLMSEQRIEQHEIETITALY
jgi:hypothetical protein